MSDNNDFKNTTFELGSLKDKNKGYPSNTDVVKIHQELLNLKKGVKPKE